MSLSYQLRIHIYRYVGLNELAKSHLRLIVTLNDDNDLMFNHKWQLFYDRITKANSEMFVLIKQEKLSNI